jgi:hypothetical protein
MIHQNWGGLVREHFKNQIPRFPNIGDSVNGKVVACAPFRIWLEKLKKILKTILLI